MTKRRDAVTRPFRPERASRETMAYLLDISSDTFDRLVKDARLPAARVCAGISRWCVSDVIGAWDALDRETHARSRVEDDLTERQELDPYRANMGVFGVKKESRRGVA